eukprot:GHVH01003096.1.p1 GENE.GHVH01003096.1~~GHVH01003096.1.p1  ORF type:complete len:2649 (-),score=391.16 GHVH01003096.1:322-8268(-)
MLDSYGPKSNRITVPRFPDRWQEKAARDVVNGKNVIDEMIWPRFLKSVKHLSDPVSELNSIMRKGYLYNVRSSRIKDCTPLKQDRTANTTSYKPNQVSNEVSRTMQLDAMQSTRNFRQCFNLFFVTADGFNFQASVLFRPYFLIEFRDKLGPMKIDVDDYKDEVINTIKSKAEEICQDGTCNVSIVSKIDLSSPHYLKRNLKSRTPYKESEFIKVSFCTERDMTYLLKDLMNVIVNNDLLIFQAERRWKERLDSGDGWSVSSIDSYASLGGAQTLEAMKDPLTEPFLDIISQDCLTVLEAVRERDIPFVSRFLIDSRLRCGNWYQCHWFGGLQAPAEVHTSSQWFEPDNLTDHISNVCIEILPHEAVLPPLRVFAWDIEVVKSPLRFPTPDVDEVMMISYLTGDGGGLIVNRSVVSEDIDHFDYSPTEEFPGRFECYNVKDEAALIQCFFEHIRIIDPHIHVTYNGDNFDMDYMWRRAMKCGMDMSSEIGFPNVLVSRLPDLSLNEAFMKGAKEFCGDSAIHVDCLRWVERDSYLPMGSRGLKAVTKAKLRFNPRELSPELMTPYATSHPTLLAEYSVSDAVCTYYLYMKYIHTFVLALSSIIPLDPDNVLRRGSGTLCESLLMARAFESTVIFPDKVILPNETYWNEWLLGSETYVGGKVDQLASGCFRKDIPEYFDTKPERFEMIISDIDEIFKHWVEREEGEGLDLKNCTNLEETRSDIIEKLERLKSTPQLHCEPLIYHLDVGAMYPNIILSNRLQPTVMVTDEDCRACEWHAEQDSCRKPLPWQCKGEYFPLKRPQVQLIKEQLSQEKFLFRYVEDLKSKLIMNYRPSVDKDVDEDLLMTEASSKPNDPKMNWDDIHLVVQDWLLKERCKIISRKESRKFKQTFEEPRNSVACQRGHTFYIQTVQDFRDRRIVYKTRKKLAEKSLENADSYSAKVSANDEVLLYESLQLAHKCILNSFYGYVMRKAARWYSMDMAAAITHQGASIIDEAYQLCQDIGTPLELDTDGIWTMLPSAFPQRYDLAFTQADGSVTKRSLFFPCSLLNLNVYRNWTNDKYLRLNEDNTEYVRNDENSIFFELDGPYKCMILPKSEKEGQKLKKRYVVFDVDDRIVELKGFEIKRRGELQLIKKFQEHVFPSFLGGNDKRTVFECVANVARTYLKMLDTKGSLSRDEKTLLPLICESKTIKKAADGSMGDQPKSMGITTAYRLSELLDDDTYITNGSVTLTYVVCAYPKNADKTMRAIPTQVFEANPESRQKFLLKWTGHEISSDNATLHNILDWDYYKSRIHTQILKLVVLPALEQGILVLPEVEVPKWALAEVRTLKRGGRQSINLLSFMTAKPAKASDLEDLGRAPSADEAPLQQSTLALRERFEADLTSKRADRVSASASAYFSSVRTVMKLNRALRRQLTTVRPFHSYFAYRSSWMSNALATEWLHRKIQEGAVKAKLSVLQINPTEQMQNGIYRLILTDHVTTFPVQIQILKCLIIACRPVNSGQGAAQRTLSTFCQHETPIQSTLQSVSLKCYLPPDAIIRPLDAKSWKVAPEFKTCKLFSVSMHPKDLDSSSVNLGGGSARAAGVVGVFPYLTEDVGRTLAIISPLITLAKLVAFPLVEDHGNGPSIVLDEFDENPIYSPCVQAVVPIQRGMRLQIYHRVDISIVAYFNRQKELKTMMVSLLEFQSHSTLSKVKRLERLHSSDISTGSHLSANNCRWRAVYCGGTEVLRDEARVIDLGSIWEESEEGVKMREGDQEARMRSGLLDVVNTPADAIARLTQWLDQIIFSSSASTSSVPLVSIKLANTTLAGFLTAVPQAKLIFGSKKESWWSQCSVFRKVIQSCSPSADVKRHRRVLNPKCDDYMSPHEDINGGGYGFDKASLRYGLLLSIEDTSVVQSEEFISNAFNIPIKEHIKSLDQHLFLWDLLLMRKIQAFRCVVTQNKIQRDCAKRRHGERHRSYLLQDRKTEISVIPGVYRTYTADVGLKNSVLVYALRNLGDLIELDTKTRGNHDVVLPVSMTKKVLQCFAQTVKAFSDTMNEVHNFKAKYGVAVDSLNSVDNWCRQALYEGFEPSVSDHKMPYASPDLEVAVCDLKRRYLSRLIGTFTQLFQAHQLGNNSTLSWSIPLLSNHRMVLVTPYYDKDRGSKATQKLMEDIRAVPLFSDFYGHSKRSYSHFCLLDASNYLGVPTQTMKIADQTRIARLIDDMEMSTPAGRGQSEDFTYAEYISDSRPQWAVTIETMLRHLHESRPVGYWPVGRRLGPALRRLLSMMVLELTVGPSELEAAQTIRTEKQDDPTAASLKLDSIESDYALRMVELPLPIYSLSEDTFTDSGRLLSMTATELSRDIHNNTYPPNTPFLDEPSGSQRLIWKALAILRDIDLLNGLWREWPSQDPQASVMQRKLLLDYLSRSVESWTATYGISSPSFPPAGLHEILRQSFSVDALRRGDGQWYSDKANSFSCQPLPHPMASSQHVTDLYEEDSSHGGREVLAARAVGPLVVRTITLEREWRNHSGRYQENLLGAFADMSLQSSHGEALRFNGEHPCDKLIKIKHHYCDWCHLPLEIPLLAHLKVTSKMFMNVAQFEDRYSRIKGQNISKIWNMDDPYEDLAYGWDCPHCLRDLDPSNIEDRLLDYLFSFMTSYQVRQLFPSGWP